MPKYTIGGGINDPNTAPITGGAQPKFRFVHYESGAVKGQTQQWSVTAGLLGVAVEDPIDASPRVAGVCAVTTAAGAWGWIQTGGYCDYVLTDTNVDAPNTDDLTDDQYLIAQASGSVTVGQSIEELLAQMESATSTAAASSVLGFNLKADAAAIGACILCPSYQ